MKFSKIAKVFLIVIAAIFIINQLFSSLYNPIKTENAVFYTATDGFKITGHIIRNETVITAEKTGVLHFVTGDGNRVAKNGTVANVYDNESASITVSQIELLDDQIADIEDVLSYNDVQAANLELINSRIKDRLEDMLFASADGNYGQMDKLAKELLSAANRKQAALGVTTGLAERLSDLKKERSNLSATLPSVKGKIRAKESGYFVSKTDGYENVFPLDDLTKITPEFLSKIKSEEIGEDVIGKIVSDYEWYIAATVSINDSLKYKEGQSLKILTTIKNSPELLVTVKSINISEKQENAVIVFSCSEMNSELATVRSSVMTVVNREYSGLKIPKNALRVVDSVSGVYVQNGMQVNFVPVNVIYTNDAFRICEKQNENGNYLKLYDKVVVKGKNLYDGKIVG